MSGTVLGTEVTVGKKIDIYSKTNRWSEMEYLSLLKTFDSITTPLLVVLIILIFI